MQRIWSVELPAHVGERVALAGWLHRLRRLSGVSFLILRDGAGLVQVVLENPEMVERAATLQPESVLRVEGEVVATPQAPRGVELRAMCLDVISPAVEFYKQTLVGVFERVFEVGPVFRAEPHDTPRHLNQYVSLDAELGFIEDHHTVMALLERALKGMLRALEDEAAEELALLQVELPRLRTPVPWIDFTEAKQLIHAATGEDMLDEPDLAPAHERWLGEWAAREHGSEFLFVTGYPLAKRPFYTHPDPARPEFSNSFDLLFRGLELVTGGQRLHTYSSYLEALQQRGLASEPFDSYLEVFKHGMPPHGGFALGLERWVARLIGAANVRETTLFPRDVHRLTP
jgi:nondiscriminating aspartyl-tRNA synthetase